MPLNIDFKEIFLHLFNFFLLLLILYVLLYKPVMDFIENRKKYYKEMEESASGKMTEAEKLLSDSKKKLEEINDEAGKIKAEALKKGTELAETRILEADKEAEEIIKNAKVSAMNESKRIMEEANAKIKDLAIETTKKILLESNDEIYDDFLKKVDVGNE
ncbi:ATP synthase F0 subunit B [Peptoniphilaceae bacterium SGI.131]